MRGHPSTDDHLHTLSLGLGGGLEREVEDALAIDLVPREAQRASQVDPADDHAMQLGDLRQREHLVEVLERGDGLEVDQPLAVVIAAIEEGDRAAPRN